MLKTNKELELYTNIDPECNYKPNFKKKIWTYAILIEFNKMQSTFEKPTEILDSKFRSTKYKSFLKKNI